MMGCQGIRQAESQMTGRTSIKPAADTVSFVYTNSRIAVAVLPNLERGGDIQRAFFTSYMIALSITALYVHSHNDRADGVTDSSKGPVITSGLVFIRSIGYVNPKIVNFNYLK